MDHWRLQHKVRGALLGVAVGDALGAPFEGAPLIDQAGQMLFEGAGSYGNGAAMRVAPVALLAFHDLRQVTRLAQHTARITHAHERGMEGAVLQVCAVALLLHQAPNTLESGAFLQALHTCVRGPGYLDKLERLHQLLPAADRHTVVEYLGTVWPPTKRCLQPSTLSFDFQTSSLRLSPMPLAWGGIPTRSPV